MLSLLLPVPLASLTDFGLVPLPGKIAIVGLLIVSLGAHEAAHAWVALKRGDTTGRDLGRITLNPIPHIDPVMSILIPGMLILSGSQFLFGGAKPVPVNFYNLRSPFRDMALVALAGPLSNFLIALLLFPILHGLERSGAYEGKLLLEILEQTIHWNLLLSAFNLLPIPPLDGSRVMAWILPRSLRAPYNALEPFGLFLVFGLLWFVPQISYFVLDTIDAMDGLIRWIGTLGGAW
jgi:Zn-dependent protease